MLKDVGRLISFRDVVYYVGDQLYKRSLRYTGLTAAVSLLGYLGNFLPGIDTYNAKVAIVLPLLVGSSMLVGGFVLKTIPSLLASRAMNVAEAQDLDLMEDYRKSHEGEHLEALWRRVFRWEWEIGSAVSQIHPHPAEAPPDACLARVASGDPLEFGRRQYLARAQYALRRAQSQPCQRYYLGIDLRFLEDWYNAGNFDRQDTKLAEQYDGSATLTAIRREARYDRWDALEDFSLKLYQKFWFKMITRAVAIYVGDSVLSFNRRYGTDYFNAQALLWPGEDQQTWVQQFPSAGEDICQQRQVILDAVFGVEDTEARYMLRRMLWPSCWLATKLRAAYDPEYVEGRLECDPVGDLEAIAVAPPRLAPYRKLMEEVRADQAALTAWIARYRPELARREYAESLRAARIAVHVRREPLRRYLRADVHDARAGEAFVENVVDVIDAAVRVRDRYTSRLVALRVHHELTRLHYQEYMHLFGLLRAGGPS